MADANIQTQSINLLTEGSIPQDADLVLINAPLSDFSSTEANILNDYLQNGGNVILITNFGEFNTESQPMPNLSAVLSNYGLLPNDGIIFEGDADYHISDYPHFLLPEVILHEITQPLMETFIVTPLAHGIEIKEDLPDYLTAYPLLQTTPSAFLKADAYTDNSTVASPDDETGPFYVAVLSENAQNNSKLVWLPTSGFTDENTDALVSGANRNLFINIISYCTNFEKGITFEAKPINAEQLTVPQSFSNLWSIVFTVVIPLATLLIGFVIWHKRRRR